MKVLIPHDEIIEMCKTMGKQITQDFAGKNPVIVCVLKGGAMFHSELIKHIDTDIIVDYIQVKSYTGQTSTGEVNFKKDLDTDIAGKDVIIVDDLVDSGRTFLALNSILLGRGARTIKFASMLDKPYKRKVPFELDYTGKVIDDLFVIGFGMDLDERYRNLKDICVYEEE